MGSLSPSASIGAPSEGSNSDEFFLQHSSLFAESLKDLKNIRAQLHSTAEYFEASYMRHEHKQLEIFPNHVRLFVENDAVAALACGTIGQLNGCVPIAGTGTIAYGYTEDGREARAASAGPVLDDWGRKRRTCRTTDQKLAQMLSRLTKSAEEFNVAVYMTNQVVADPGGGVFMFDPKKLAGGHVLAHAATIRLMFRKGKGEQFVCKVFDAQNLPEAKAVFQITTGGIANAED